MNNYESDKLRDGYYQHRRENISKFIDKKESHVLDVGCAAGNFGAFLKNSGQASEVIGIEVDQQAADQAGRNLDKVYCADLNQTSVDEILGTSDKKPFDYIICADVLEHLVNPWQILGALALRLAPGGKIIASIPNVRHWSVLIPLLFQGKWQYLDSGIMDRTHLRFFTRTTMMQLFDDAGLNVSEIQPLIGGKWKLVDKYSLRLLRGFVAVQWVLVGTQKADKI